MVPGFKSKVGVLPGVFVLSVLLFGCQETEPEPEVLHPIIGTWDRSSYHLEIVVQSGKSLIDFFKDQGLSDEEAAFHAQTLLVPVEDNSAQTLEFKKDGTYQVTTLQSTLHGTWELSDDEQSILFNKGLVAEFIVTTGDIEKLTDNELDLIISVIGSPEAGLTTRQSYGFLKE